VVEVGPGAAEVRADLALPGAPALAAAVCGARGDSTGVLLGRVLDAERGEPVAGGAVVVRWGEVVLDRRGVGGRSRSGAGPWARAGATPCAACPPATTWPCRRSRRSRRSRRPARPPATRL
jgi:hypothetical protein